MADRRKGETIMRILAIKRSGQMANYEVGAHAEQNNNVVSAINFYETGCAGHKVWHGPCFVISFVNNSSKVVIPATAENILEVTYDNSDTVTTKTHGVSLKKQTEPVNAETYKSDVVEMEA